MHAISTPTCSPRNETLPRRNRCAVMSVPSTVIGRLAPADHVHDRRGLRRRPLRTPVDPSKSAHESRVRRLAALLGRRSCRSGSPHRRGRPTGLREGPPLAPTSDQVPRQDGRSIPRRESAAGRSRGEREGAKRTGRKRRGTEKKGTGKEGTGKEGTGKEGTGKEGTEEKRSGKKKTGSARADPVGRSRNYSMTSDTTPEATVRPPSRMAKRSSCSMAIGVMSSPMIVTLSPGMTISVPSGRVHTPVTSVVRK